ncbi:unnamed protein product [Polarella glacialis]|uniref:Calmodulin-lysine N-methyltransferase n=1 Tax=Polarella glacialis TaxID=89957 RepID=A0A813EJN2_POLGL|nr:unnamed protein product [Polarella glacialis]
MRSQGPRSAEGEGEPELLSVVRKVRTLLRMGAPDAEEALRQALAWAQEGEEPSEAEERQAQVQGQLLRKVLQDPLGRLYPPTPAARRRVVKPLLASLEQGAVDEVDDELFAACVEEVVKVAVVKEGGSDEDDGDAAAVAARSSRGYILMELPEGCVVLRVAENLGGGLETGCVLWTAGCMLMGLCASGALDQLLGAHVLELGSGTGLVGLAVASRGALSLCNYNNDNNNNNGSNSSSADRLLERPVSRVTLTDREPAVLENLRHNLSATAALAAPGGTSEATTLVEVCQLEWSQPDLKSLPAQKIDVVVGADIVYDAEAIPGLTSLLRQLLRPRGTAKHALVAQMVRNEATFEKLQEALTAEGLVWDFPDLGPDAWAFAESWKRCGNDYASCLLSRVVLLRIMPAPEVVVQ